MKRNRWIVLALALALALGAAGGYAFWRVKGRFISRQAALESAFADAGVARDTVFDLEAELDKEYGLARYEVEFTAGGTEYEYVLDAATGQILSRWQEPEHQGSGRR